MVLSCDEQLAAEAISSGDQLLTTEDVAEWLGVTVVWLKLRRRKRRGPRCIRLSSHMIRYRRSDVFAWLDSRTTEANG
jgi:predicted DNA-binding transcriptional regulator AlpA